MNYQLGGNPDEWPRIVTQNIGRKVKELRGTRTALWLSDETAKLGMRISRSALSELENQKRKSISLAEFLVLSAALDVPPALLLYPDYPDGQTDLLPHLQADSHEAAEWMSGERLLVLSPHPSLEPFAHPAVKLVRERENLLSNAMKIFESGGSDALELIDHLRRRRSEIDKELESLGYTVDPQHLENGEG